jgi:hypothetical protein
MKFLALLGLTIAVLFIAVQAHTTTIITLDPVECKDLLNYMWPNITPYDTNLENPLDNLKWFNITDIKITKLDAEECKVYHRDIHGYRIVAKGISATLDGKFAYKLEPGMPVVEDKGAVSAVIEKGQLFARIDLLGEDVYRNFGEVLRRFDTEATIADDDDSAEWVADVVTIIPKMTITTSETPYAEVYNKILAEHDAELRLLASIMANEQISTWMEEYCNEHDHNRCEEHPEGSFVEFMRQFTDDIVVETTPDHPPVDNNNNNNNSNDDNTDNDDDHDDHDDHDDQEDFNDEDDDTYEHMDAHLDTDYTSHDLLVPTHVIS